MEGTRVALTAVEGRKTRGIYGQTDARGMAKLFVPAGNIELKAVGGDGLEGSVSVSVNAERPLSADIQLRGAVVR